MIKKIFGFKKIISFLTLGMMLCSLTFSTVTATEQDNFSYTITQEAETVFPLYSLKLPRFAETPEDVIATYNSINMHILRQTTLTENIDINGSSSLNVMDSYALKQVALGQKASDGTLKGIDISKWQGNIDWSKVQATDTSFVIIRAGYGNTVDPYFYQNINGAKSHNLDCGVYWFSYATNVLEAEKEAQIFLDTIKGYKLEYPVVYDYEYDSLVDGLTRTAITDMAVAFMEKIESAGYYTMLYSNLDFSQNYFDMTRLSNYDFWFARPGVNAPEIKCGIWQSSFTGKVNGILGDVDLNIAYKDYPAIMKRSHLNGY